MKPSEIRQRMTDAETAAAPLRAQLQPLEEEIESLKQQKAEIINRLGAKLRRLREGRKPAMSLEDYRAFRESVSAANEDEREAMVDAKLAEHELA